MVIGCSCSACVAVYFACDRVFLVVSIARAVFGHECFSGNFVWVRVLLVVSLAWAFVDHQCISSVELSIINSTIEIQS